MNYTDHFSTKKTTQGQKVPGKNQIQNSSGAYVFKTDKWKTLDRFLIIGTEGGTYYASEKQLTVESANAIVALIKEDGPRVVNTLTEISVSGRAVKNDPAIFVLALACSFGNQDTKNLAYKSITKVCRIGTHIFTFCEHISKLRGWSNGLRKGVSAFYENREADKVAYQVLKYRQRNNWDHTDVLNLCHPRKHKGEDNAHAALYRWIVGNKELNKKKLPELVNVFEEIQSLKVDKKNDLDKACYLIASNELPWEFLPTEFLNHKEIWDHLLLSIPLTALVRNLAKMTTVGVLDNNFGTATKFVCEMLTNEDEIEKAKIHPMTLLLALKNYSAGHGFKGKLRWSPVSAIVESLEDAFNNSFKNVAPMNQRVLIALDVSGSMTDTINNTNLSCIEAETAISLVTVKSEPQVEIMAFSSNFKRLNITKNSNWDSAMRQVSDLSCDSTDCSLPMVYAQKNKIPVDLFMVFTDNETNHRGSLQPHVALKEYRQKLGINSKLVVNAMATNEFSIADESDPGMLDVIGFDSDMHSIIREFALI